MAEGFDPDKWLEEAEQEFDPDAYLEEDVEARPAPTDFSSVTPPKETTAEGILRSFVHGAAPFGTSVPASGLYESAREEGLLPAASTLPGLGGLASPEEKQRAEEAYMQGKQKQREYLRSDRSGPEMVAEIGGGLLQGGATRLLGKGEIPVEMASEGAAAIQEGAGPGEVLARAAAAPVMAGVGKGTAKVASAITPALRSANLNDYVNKIASQIKGRFTPEVAGILQENITNYTESALMDVLKNKNVNPEQFFRELSRGEQDAIKLANSIVGEIADRAGEGVARHALQLQDMRGAKALGELEQSQEFGRREIAAMPTGEDVLTKEARRAEVQVTPEEIRERGRLRAGTQASPEDIRARGLQQLDVSERMRQANEELKNVESNVRVSLEKAALAKGEDASRIAKEELKPMYQDLNRKGAELESETVRKLSLSGSKNPYTPEDVGGFYSEAKSILDSLDSLGKNVGDLRESLNTARSTMLTSDSMADAFIEVRKIKKQLGQVKATSPSERRDLARLRGLLNSTLYDKIAADVPEAALANQYFIQAGRTRDAYNAFTGKSKIGWGEVVAPGKPMAEARRTPEMMSQLESLPLDERQRQAFGAVAEEAALTPGEKAQRLQQAPEMMDARARAEQVRREQLGMRRGEVEERARRAEAQQGLTAAETEAQATRAEKKQALRSTEAQEKAQSAEAKRQLAEEKLAASGESKIASLNLDEQTREVNNAVNAMLRGDEPGGLGRSAIKLNTGVTDKEIDAVIASRKARDIGGAEQLEAVADVPETFTRGVTTPEEIRTTLAGARLGTNQEVRELAQTLLSRRGEKPSMGIITKLGNALGVGAGALTKVPLLGSSINLEIARALKEQDPIRLMTEVADVISKAEQKGIKLGSNEVAKNIKRVIAEGTEQGLRQFVRETGRSE